MQVYDSYDVTYLCFNLGETTELSIFCIRHASNKIVSNREKLWKEKSIKNSLLDS
jgi:hypothetical protein